MHSLNSLGSQFSVSEQQSAMLTSEQTLMDTASSMIRKGYGRGSSNNILCHDFIYIGHRSISRFLNQMNALYFLRIILNVCIWKNKRYICKFVTKQLLRDHATYHRNKLCQYVNILRSSGKLHVYLVCMILLFYYETIIR